ncbi:MAG: DUF4838 domain-containing protein [Oscillospiraceae bacterium]|nr:DUF4838 domain-containing protein [Oscillospiraceae bacterium]
MLQINKLRADHVIDFAAEELKKYLRMMMPEEKQVDIIYNPDATEGFRLGLLEDFSLPCEANDPAVDDIVHIETTQTGGILAGSNPRSVLFAVYRYLKLNGCRFLFPGAEGEHIPHKPVEPQSYHKLADHRYRGHSIEGDPSLEQVLTYIDWHAKEELNSFGGYGIFNYMTRYYKHRFNNKHRASEYMDPYAAETQWRALFECEVKKRGLLLFGGGHDLVPKALGLNPEDNDLYKAGKKEVPPEVIPFLAEIDGKRGLRLNNLFFTNVCLSNPEVRHRIAMQTVRRFTENPLVDITGISLSDGAKNHCECAECAKKRPSDWLVMILNEVDEEMTKLGLPNKVNFGFYIDVMFAPTQEKLNNPDRFTMTFCPITRSYTSTISDLSDLPEPIPYVRNAWRVPKTSEEIFSLLQEWQKVYTGAVSVFEYHYWHHQYRDPGLAAISRRIYEDVLSYRPTGMNGCMEDGSNRSFFPHGFHSHIFAEAMLNRELDYEAELADYLSHLYGEDWQIVKEYLDDITAAFGPKFMNGEQCDDPAKGSMYCPAQAESLASVKTLTAQMREVIAAHKQLPTRPQSNAWRILLRHTEYCDGMADVYTEKALGNNEKAWEMLQEFYDEFGKYDLELERWFDFGLWAVTMKKTVLKKPEIEL